MHTARTLRRAAYKTLGIKSRVPEGYIYVLLFSNGIVKMGRTAKPHQRFKDIAKANESMAIVRAWVSPLHFRYGTNELDLLSYFRARAQFHCSEYMKGLDFDEVVARAETYTFKREPGFEIFNRFLATYEGEIA